MDSTRVSSGKRDVKAAFSDMGKLLKGLDLFTAPLP